MSDLGGAPRVLYVVYWGAAEPLGQSLVLPQVARLASLGARITLLTFDKASDLAHPGVRARIAEQMDAAAVRWVPLRYHKRPKWPATLFDVAHGVVRGIWEGARLRPQILHARTFVGGVIGLVLAPLIGTRLVYHNEGFYPDEQVDGGIWKEGSVAHRLTRAVERLLYRRARGIVTLSNRGRDAVQALRGRAGDTVPVAVVPSCVDIDSFANAPREVSSDGVLRLVYVGSIGGRYRFDNAGAFVVAARRRLGRVRLRVLTRHEPALIASVLEKSGLPRENWSVASVPYHEMPGELSRQNAGLFLFTQGISEHGCSPTKIGEYWASGIPVVTTPNVSDTDEIIARERVGVIVPEDTPDGYARAVDDLVDLLADPDLSRRCRAAAECHYALGPACERLFATYRRVMDQG